MLADAPQPKRDLRSFLYGLAVSVLILISFFSGAIADRVFVIKPLDYLLKRTGGATSLFEAPSPDNTSKLGQMIRENGNLSVPEVAEVASESVVTVAIQAQQRIFEPSPGDPFGFFGLGNQRVEQVQQDIGTGFIVDNTGLIVTNKHVVSSAAADGYKVIDKNNQEYKVTQIYRDPGNDLAILKIEGANLSPLALGDSDKLKVGEGVIAIGTALGEFRHTVTTGVISGLGRGITAGDGFSSYETLENVIQTDAAINPGNSGGPLLNMRGEVIGVNVAVSVGAQNVGFALPINVIKASLENFNKTGQFDRPFLGVSYLMISAEQAVRMEVPQGALVRSVMDGSVASEAGISPNDIITSIDGTPLREDELAQIINRKKVGDQMKIEYWRNGEKKEATVTLRTAPAQ